MSKARKLPPLNALRAFEAAARHSSFMAAAEELHVTASAISQQVKQLEEWLGLALFQRLPRGLALSDEGRRYLPGLTDALDAIAEETRRVQDRGDDFNLTVTVMPSMAALWLVPRLHRFTDSHPEITVRVVSSTELVDLNREDVDVAIRFGLGNYPGLFVEKLMDEEIYPVCSPILLEKGPPIETLEDLKNHLLLQDSGSVFPYTKLCWPEWFAHFGIDEVDLSHSPIFNDTHLTTMAAVSGRGIMLGRSVLTADALESGALIKPLDVDLPADVAYYFVCRKDRQELPKIRAFRDWLHLETTRPTSN
ncbi:transcriptional regulator GcvA [Aestuariispira insulae]|uniref:LysR family glycine cleavage system transcriptional activator n=1 Tax=Aestuariispira insulae TaxID=1461337 RepID=A0A3D9HJR5_9PROT|nr:transcriptional regulator GcvA [Aestuariispira insulae]RED49703.1 LysR family glycine cleavage system transcriptional activator [Aestuariispira insulae]